MTAVKVMWDGMAGEFGAWTFDAGTERGILNEELPPEADAEELVYWLGSRRPAGASVVIWAPGEGRILAQISAEDLDADAENEELVEREAVMFSNELAREARRAP